MRVKRVLYSSHFQRALRFFGSEQRVIIEERIKLFQNNCFDPQLKTHKLKGKLKGHWAFSLTHSHRVLFKFLDKESVGFIDVGDHSIYQ